MIFAGPAVQPPFDRVVNDMVHVVDVYTTILALIGAGTTPPPGVTIDGKSMVQYLENTSQPPIRDFVFAELFEGPAWPAPLQTVPAFRTTSNPGSPRKWNHLGVGYSIAF